MFGHAPGAERDRSLPEALVAVSARAGMPVWIPDDAPGHCCGTPWTSKGHKDAARLMAQRTHDALWRWTDGGRLPVVIDASSCALGLGAESAALLDEARAAQHAELQILDSVVWAHNHLLPNLDVSRKLDAVAVHPTCATRKQGLAEALVDLAGALADDVVVPVTSTCCGMAGDRGLLHPELTQSATAPMAAELSGRTFDARWSTNRTCEIGLQQATGAAYESIIFALDDLTA
jgi:D-lactate dehydrogenase